ncbi:MAG: hypothetical protein IKB47_00595 [Clostridia bacterium]|nr:hypothetical protein [Clostridia bacterium]
MTYINAVKFLNSRIEGVPSPERMRLLCRYLGDPQRHLRFIHIAGGAGKSSTATMLSVILAESGYKIGRLTTSVVREPRELISVSNSPISHKDFAKYVERVVSAAETMKADIKASSDGVEPCEDETSLSKKPKITKNLLEGRISPDPIRSEIVTAAAFLAFKENDCNLALLECGESRADPTSIIDPPLVSVVCGKSFSDDQLRTGVGIIRRGTREVVSSAPMGEAYNAILDACVRTGARLTVPARGELKLIRSGLGSRDFEYRGKEYSVPFCAEYQLLNALTAIETVYALRRTGTALHSADVSRGISRARIPLRFELFAASPAVIIDGAATDEQALALCESLSAVSQMIGKRLVVVSDSHICVSPDRLEALGFTVAEEMSPVTEADDKRVAARLRRLSSDETMLILGSLTFTGRVKNAVLRFMAYT